MPSVVLVLAPFLTVFFLLCSTDAHTYPTNHWQTQTDIRTHTHTHTHTHTQTRAFQALLGLSRLFRPLQLLLRFEAEFSPVTDWYGLANTMQCYSLFSCLESQPRPRFWAERHRLWEEFVQSEMMNGFDWLRKWIMSNELCLVCSESERQLPRVRLTMNTRGNEHKGEIYRNVPGLFSIRGLTVNEGRKTRRRRNVGFDRRGRAEETWLSIGMDCYPAFVEEGMQKTGSPPSVEERM